MDFFINDNHVTLSNNSSFVKVNDQIHHMITNAQLIDNIFFVPLNSFSRLYKQFKTDNFKEAV